MMENNSGNETEQQQSFHSPPRRRRSTFFERRDSIVFTGVPNENKDIKVGFGNKEQCNKYDEEMERYYKNLLTEKELWKKEVKERRNKYHDLKQQFQLEAKSKTRLSYSTLSNEDIEFLKKKPNIANIVEKQAKLHESVELLRAFYSRCNELDNIILEHCEEKINKITDYILENSTIEPINAD